MYAHDPEEIAQNPLDLGSFLKVHMLGIISYMSEMLQEIKAKATLSFKKQILRSLGALVSIIGPSINAVSPQVQYESFTPNCHRYLTLCSTDSCHSSSNFDHSRVGRRYAGHLAQILDDPQSCRHRTSRRCDKCLHHLLMAESLRVQPAACSTVVTAYTRKRFETVTIS